MGSRIEPWDRLALATVPIVSFFLQQTCYLEPRMARLRRLAVEEPGRIEQHVRAANRGWRMRDCGFLERQLGMDTSGVGGYELVRCVGAGRVAEVWEVQAPGDDTKKSLAMKLWKSAVETPDKVCNIFPIAQKRNPEHLNVCRERGNHTTGTGICLAYTVGDLVQEVPLYQFRNASDAQLPEHLSRLKGVFDVCLQLFNLTQEGMDSFDHQSCQLRYIFGDPHPWNVFVDNGGKVRLMDFDDMRCCAHCSDDDALESLPKECQDPCQAHWVKHYRREVVKVMLQSLLVMLTRWEGDVFQWESHCFYSEACWTLVGGWEMAKPEEFDRHLGGRPFSNYRVSRVMRHLLARIRGIYFSDWSLLPNATGSLVEAFLAVRDRDDTWPPRLLSFIQDSHAALK